MRARDVAKKFAGIVVDCIITKSAPVLVNGSPINNFKGRIIGWKSPNIKDKNEYLLLECMPNVETKFLVKDFKLGCNFTIKPIPIGSYGKRLFVDEVILPAENNKKLILDYPGICPSCSAPAFVSLNLIDCSNKSCKHKYTTKDAKDLFNYK